MGTLSKRTTFSAEFKAKIALAAIRGQETLPELAQAHGVHPTQIGLWKKELLEGASTLFAGKRGVKSKVDPKADHQAPERLYSEIGRLKMELDWLKKKSGIYLP